jgi:hypothetical protein
MANYSVGEGSHLVEFVHPTVGSLAVYTGVDQVSWGYNLVTQRWPTYGGEVVQILACYVDDLEVQGTLRNYRDLETVYSYFLQYIQVASAEGERDEHPMLFRYPHRGWEFKIMVTQAPGYRKATELTVPEWRIVAHIVDSANDAEELSQLILDEAEIKGRIGDTGKFDEHFGLEGKIRYIDENPFSDPWTDHEQMFKPGDYTDDITDFYSKLLPAYMDGDWDTIFSGIGSKPSFDPVKGPKGSVDADDYEKLQQSVVTQIIETQKKQEKDKTKANK